MAAGTHYYAQWFKRKNAEPAAVVDPQERIRKILEFWVHSCLIDQKKPRRDGRGFRFLPA